MMAELVSRRLTKGNHPDLFLVDGGKGHLMAVMRVLKAAKSSTRPEVIAIAKSHEHGVDKTDRSKEFPQFKKWQPCPFPFNED